MNILIIGSGSYVLQDPYGPGVILRSVVQWCRNKECEPDSGHKITLTYNSDTTLPAKELITQKIIEELGGNKNKVTIEFVETKGIENILNTQDIAACFIAVPDQFHAQYVKVCLRFDCPVWIVKPLTGNLCEAEELMEMCGRSQLPVWVDYHKRFDPSNIYLKTQIRKGDLGKLLVYTVDYHQPYKLPLEVFDWTSEVDVFTYIGCHYVDQVFYLFPEAKPQSVSTSPIKGKVYSETGQFDGILATIVFDVLGNELLCPMNIGWFNPNGSPTKSLQRLKVQFERGLIELDQTERGVSLWSDDGVAEVNPYFFSEQLDIRDEMIVAGYGFESISVFLTEVSKKGPSASFSGACPTIAEALKTEYVLDGIRRSVLSGKIHEYKNT